MDASRCGVTTSIGSRSPRTHSAPSRARSSASLRSDKAESTEPRPSKCYTDEIVMAAATSLFPVHPRSASEEQRVLLTNVPWSVYVLLRDAIDSPGVRMTYLRGELEIMSPSKAHEVSKKQIARLLELFCIDRDI